MFPITRNLRAAIGISPDFLLFGVARSTEGRDRLALWFACFTIAFSWRKT